MPEMIQHNGIWYTWKPETAQIEIVTDVKIETIPITTEQCPKEVLKAFLAKFGAYKKSEEREG